MLSSISYNVHRVLCLYSLDNREYRFTDNLHAFYARSDANKERATRKKYRLCLPLAPPRPYMNWTLIIVELKGRANPRGAFDETSYSEYPASMRWYCGPVHYRTFTSTTNIRPKIINQNVVREDVDHHKKCLQEVSTITFLFQHSPFLQQAGKNNTIFYFFQSPPVTT